MRSLLRAALTAALACTLAPAALAGRIVVNHDEWTLSNSGASLAGGANVSTFVGNLAEFMNIDGDGCSFLVYSGNFGLTQSAFTSGMAAAGCSLTTYTGAFNTGAGTLANYDGVFLALAPSTYDAATLAAYVNAGGSAYIAAGTGVGGAAAEAAVWNPFLNLFGLNLGSSYNGCCGVDAMQVDHAIEAGVGQLYYNNGNTVSLVGANPHAQVIEFSASGLGLIGVYDDVATGVPEPAGWALALLALGVLGRVRAGRGQRRIA